MNQNEQTLLRITETAQSVFTWIQDKCENGASDEELKVLPEVIKGAAELGKLIHHLMEDGFLR
ncbi:hypothetical protein [Brevibacillus aydinogluensis]|uniref:Uncharacterized protein n=1 Tax=Brevibacillus aydinogluensis TaxID=927786 RepID=A0AA48M6T0_9BACL|nr:hypothetical protein [Brevibacillus aydinogluensis]CAJ1000981.1 hypothetical protein BSPP4475_01400 [Brevibacillus aydinogluensis]